MCNECGNCETFCPHRGSPYRDKVTLFRNENEFNSSSNDGFYISHSNDETIIVTRLNSKYGKFNLSGEPIDYACPPGDTGARDKDEDEEKKKLGLYIKKIVSDYQYLLNTIEL
jgi:hypothetical protein